MKESTLFWVVLLIVTVAAGFATAFGCVFAGRKLERTANERTMERQKDHAKNYLVYPFGDAETGIIFGSVTGS
jgi:hypothetical protein